LRLRAALAAGRLTQDGDTSAPISVSVDGTDERREGRLLFSDITVDRSTGQVSLRGEIPNHDGLLLPGMYVRVHVGQGIDPQAILVPRAILVPQRAVRRGADGKAQVQVLDPDDVVQLRPVRTGAMHGSDWHIVEGLQSGERVVVAGTANPGDKVDLAPPGRTEPASTGDVPN